MRRKGLRLTLCWTRLVAGLSGGSIGFDDLVQAAPTPLGAFSVPPPRRCSPPALASSRRVPARGRLEAFVRGGCRVSVREQRKYRFR